MERAIPYIERIVQLPVTKENKFSLVVFIVGTFYIKPFIRWIVFLCKKQRNMQTITKMDLSGYYRTQGIIRYVEGNMEASRTYMKKADQELKSAEKSEMGYLQVEREWFGD